jgi:hypothetical protein
MALISFTAKVLKSAGVESDLTAPERVHDPATKVAVKNPFTGYRLWLEPSQVKNYVDGHGNVVIRAHSSGRFPTTPADRRKPNLREFINPLTGNTFMVDANNIIEETA